MYIIYRMCVKIKIEKKNNFVIYGFHFFKYKFQNNNREILNGGFIKKKKITRVKKSFLMINN